MNALVASKKYPGKLPNTLVDMEENLLSRYVESQSVAFYQDKPKPLQVDVVTSLVKGQNVFC
ncbi:hypothetical protein PCANC_19519 [Puccinia coronata f. sp. avenae]|uniref:Uncharacterized protein n=1 Tax=Puccinia coronata f. sp. avenae TaxID=200324 RepID=A0A2N5SG05_9BASI|nr:hypothetical protein PCANC_19519 [Puccinia coronata f. sp. avenae]